MQYLQWAKLFWSRLLEGYCSCITPSRYPKNHLGFITYLLKLVGVLHNHTKT
jgi:hypothetical protein